MGRKRTYICIDLKSFYASVECRERNLDPMKTNLVVADLERTDRTICLAVSPAMKALGVPGRCRVFEIPSGISYITAPPRMQLYIDYSAKIYAVYLKYIAKEDLHVYSIDEIFMDVTDYLALYEMTAKELCLRMMEDVLETTGIPAAAGIGSNLYLAKIAMDITGKHASDRIGILDEDSYRRHLWDHRPLTDFWRIGSGIANQLKRIGITTMREIAQADERKLYRMFGIDAELLIDHAWGRESVTMEDIKAYRPRYTSLSSGQVLSHDYRFQDGRMIVREMADALCLELTEKDQITESITLHVGYSYRLGHKPAHGTISLRTATDSSRRIMDASSNLYEQIVDPHLSIRRITLTFNRVTDRKYQQYDLFYNPHDLEKEHRMQKTVLEIKDRFGKNALFRGMDLQEGATALERNRQIGGHKSGA